MEAAALSLFQRVEFEFTDGERDAFRNVPFPKLKDFAEAEVVVPFGNRKGKFRASYVPYLAAKHGPFEASDNPATREINYAAPTQTGKSLLGHIAHARQVKYRPSSSFIVLGKREASGNVSRDYVQPIFENSPGLEPLLPRNRDDRGKNRIAFYNGHTSWFAYANSITTIQSFAAESIVGDERKDWPVGGSTAARARVTQYEHTSLIVWISSLTDDGEHWKDLSLSQDLRIFHVKCPVCGHVQVPVWGGKDGEQDDADQDTPGVKFPSTVADPDDIIHQSLAFYRCAGDAACILSEAQFNRSVTLGEWISVEKKALEPGEWENPHPARVENPPVDPVTVGFLLPCKWVSQQSTMAKAATDFLKAVREPDPVERLKKLRDWTNEHRNRPWIEKKKAAIEKDALLAHRDERPWGVVPEWAVVLTAMADTQDNGLWYAVRAFDADRTSAGVIHGFLPKTLAGVSDFEALKNILTAPFKTTGGREMHVRFALIDHGGHRPTAVEDFCRQLPGFLLPAKGSSTALKERFKSFAIDKNPNDNKPIQGGLHGILHDPNVFKDQLTLLLSTPPGQPGSWYLNRDQGAEHAAHFVAEARDPASGKWEQIGSRANHLWDCEVGNLVAFAVLVNASVVAQLKAPPPAPAASQNPNRPTPSRLSTNPNRRAR